MGASNTDTAPGARQVAETASQEGQDLARNAADSTRQVAETAKQQTGEVIQEASTQARDFAAQARTVVTEQADQQRQRLAGALRDSGRELSEFAGRDAQSPITTELTRRAGGYAQTVGDYLEKADPQRILNDVRSFARRRPGAFLLIAAVGGVVAGRLTRGVASAHSSDTPSPSNSAPDRSSVLTTPEPVGTTDVAPVVVPDQPASRPGSLP